MTTRIRRLEDLQVYLLALSGAEWIFRTTRRWPREERFQMTAQILDAARAVAALIAEAWGRRTESAAAFVSKLSEAAAEAMEVRSWLDMAAQCAFITADDRRLWKNHYTKVHHKLTHMKLHPQQWAPRRRFDPVEA